MREAAGAQRLGDGEVGVGEIHVLPDERDGDARGRVLDTVEQVVPGGPVDVAERDAEAPDDVGVKALSVQHARDGVDAGRIGAADHGLVVDVAHGGDLALQAGADLALGAADDGVGLDADLAERGHGVLGRLGLHLPRRLDVGHERDVEEEDVGAPHHLADLARGLEERQRLDVADGASHLVDHDVDGAVGHREHAVADLAGDVRDDLHGVAEEVAAAFFRDDGRVHLPGGDVGVAAEVDVEEALVVADVEVGLRAVVGDEDLAVLERVHGSRIDVQVRVELLHGDPETARLEQAAEAGGREPLAERRDDPAGHEDVLCRFLGAVHGSPA